MDWLTFLASIVASLAWPSAVLVLLLILREPLRALVPFLQRFKYKDLVLEFGRHVEELKDEVAEELSVEARAALEGPEADEALRLAEVSPRAAVLEAWRGVEQAALAAARRLGGDAFQQRSFTFQAIRFLERNESLDRGIVSLLRDLRGLRNQAAHAPDFALTKESALEYARSAGAVARYLGNVGRSA